MRRRTTTVKADFKRASKKKTNHRHQRPCPTPNKRRLNQNQAHKHAVTLTRRAGQPIRHYHCTCGWWHLSRWKYRTKTENIKAARQAAHEHAN